MYNTANRTRHAYVCFLQLRATRRDFYFSGLYFAPHLTRVVMQIRTRVWGVRGLLIFFVLFRSALTGGEAACA